MQPSPYRPGELAPAVPGRELQVFEADERLAVLCDLGRLAGRAQVFTAARGFGKTSLLREIQRRAEARGAMTVWVTAGEEHGLVAALADGMRELASGWPEVARLLPVLEQATVSVSLGVARGEATVRPRRDAPEPRGTRGLEKAIREVVGAGRRHDRRALAIFVDEIQAADAAGLRTLAYAWQHLQAEGADVPAGIFAAGLPDAPSHIVRAVSSSERFAYVDLEPLPSAAVVAALADVARPLGVTWEPSALDAAVETSAGYPFTVQLLGDHTWRVARFPDPGAVITAGQVHEGARRVAREIERLIEGRFERATPAEQAFLTAMAALGDGPVARADIAARLGAPTTRVSTQRAALLKDGLIRSAGYGLVEFTIPGMARYLRRRAEGVS